MPADHPSTSHAPGPLARPNHGILALRTQIDAGVRLLEQRPIAKDDYSSWQLATRNYLEKIFGPDSKNISSVMDVGKYAAAPIGPNREWWENHRATSLQSQLSQLGVLVEFLEMNLRLTLCSNDGEMARDSSPKNNDNGKSVFVAHGHDHGSLEQVARLLERLQQHVVILHEQPSGGRTIIEKFEAHSDVGFAVVVLTADDRGGPADATYDRQLPRARQNVIFELGYFVGKLGRNHVCALYETGVEVPSDYAGVLYIHLDSAGAWRLALAKELRAAGLAIEFERIP